MAKWKADYHKNTKVIRVTLGQYGLLKQLADNHGLSIAEALDLILHGRAQQEQISAPAAQIPILEFTAAAKPAFTVRARPILSTNGHIPISTKAKGGVIADG